MENEYHGSESSKPCCKTIFCPNLFFFFYWYCLEELWTLVSMIVNKSNMLTLSKLCILAYRVVRTFRYSYTSFLLFFNYVCMFEIECIWIILLDFDSSIDHSCFLSSGRCKSYQMYSTLKSILQFLWIYHADIFSASYRYSNILTISCAVIILSGKIFIVKEMTFLSHYFHRHFISYIFQF